MNCGIWAKFQINIFRLSMGLAVVVHVVAIFLMILTSQGQGEPKFKPLAVINFAHYDPDGGQGGGSIEEPAPTPVFLPESETATATETEIPEDIKALDLVTSTAEIATPAPVVPAVVEKKIKPKPKPTVKPKPKPKTEPKPKPEPKLEPSLENKSGAGGQGYNFNSKQPGGGPGQGKGGLGQGTGKGNANLLAAYKSKITAKINRLKKYPSAARSKRLAGTAVLTFTINSQGVVSASRLSKKSGQAIFDREALALIKRCSPFPPFPKELGRNSMQIRVPINFSPPR